MEFFLGFIITFGFTVAGYFLGSKKKKTDMVFYSYTCPDCDFSIETTIRQVTIDVGTDHEKTFHG